MSVLIKGMEMPQNCEECPIVCRIGVEGFGFHSDKRADDCPIVELPTPHGRLIDADALSEIAGKRCGVINIRHIDEAPTIIEEEGVTE